MKKHTLTAILMILFCGIQSLSLQAQDLKIKDLKVLGIDPQNTEKFMVSFLINDVSKVETIVFMLGTSENQSDLLKKELKLSEEGSKIAVNGRNVSFEMVFAPEMLGGEAAFAALLAKSITGEITDTIGFRLK